ncbi:MAG TPA: Rrf2 family transcriptional regulator [Chloroflexota bacterium]|nr:Rrf2 family transcriptional regulator [Chloroflexota bacterium]
MHIGRTGQYALRTVLTLAEQGAATVESISARHAIPSAYLQRLIPALAAQGIIRAKRGPGGGIALLRPPSTLSLLEVLRAVGADNEAEDRRWLEVIPQPYRFRLESAERHLSSELALLTVGDLLLSASLSPELRRPLELLPPRRLIDFIGRQAATSVKADHCTLYFGKLTAGYYTTAFDRREIGADNVPIPTEHPWLPLTPVGVLAEAARVGEPVLVSDVMTDPRPSREMAVRFDVRSVSAIPIPVGQEGWGALIVANRKPHSWSAEEVAAEVELADITRLAIIGHNHLVTHQQEEPFSTSQS